MGSCFSRASMGGFLDPTATVTKIEYKGIGLQGVSIEATLRVENPNLGTLDGTNITYKVRKKSDGTLLADGDVPRDFQVYPREATTVSLPVRFNYGGMGAAGASVLRRGRTELIVEGALTFVAPLADKGTLDVPFRGEAEIVLADDPPSS